MLDKYAAQRREVDQQVLNAVIKPLQASSLMVQGC